MIKTVSSQPKSHLRIDHGKVIKWSTTICCILRRQFRRLETPDAACLGNDKTGHSTQRGHQPYETRFTTQSQISVIMNDDKVLPEATENYSRYSSSPR